MRVLTAMNRFRLRPALIGAVALSALGACNSLTESNPSPNRYASISIKARNGASNRATANATAIFFEAFTAAVPNSALSQTDQCVYAAVDTTISVTKGVKKAGASVSLGIGSGSITLAYDDVLFRYANPVASPFGYAAGDNVQASILGDAAVYPASSIAVRLAEPLIPGTITVPTTTAPMVFSWNSPAAGDTTSAIILSLRYSNPATIGYANEQIYCALKDDGNHQLPTSALTAFLASPNDKRSLVLTRWRTRELLVDAKTVLHIASSVDTTLKFTP